MHFEIMEGVRVTVPRAALNAIFDECDRYDHDETGGRVIGTYAFEDEQLILRVEGVIGPGPGARRTMTSFYQDGEHQEAVFRQIEQHHAKIEHLGNWHTHHVNGYPTLSGGDVATYRRTVNHPQHNTTFFYALLVVSKHKHGRLHERYGIKHYIVRKSDDNVYEIPADRVDIVDAPLVWPKEAGMGRADDPKGGSLSQRVYDRDILNDFYQGLRPYSSQRLGLYWRGPIELINGSHVEIILLEADRAGEKTYSVTLRQLHDGLEAVAEAMAECVFPSARAAAITVERMCNRWLFERHARDAIRPQGQ